MAYQATIRKDDFTPSKPWCADVDVGHGRICKNAFYNYRTKKALVRAIEAIGAVVKA